MPVIARRKERLEKLAGAYKDKKIVPIEADFGDEKSYDKLSERLEKDKPHVKVLINNAGYVKSGMFSDMRQEDILSMISVNVKGMTMIQKHFFPIWRKAVLPLSPVPYLPLRLFPVRRFTAPPKNTFIILGKRSGKNYWKKKYCINLDPQYGVRGRKFLN